MGWFDEQIRQRKQNDEDVFADSFGHIAGAVTGRRVFAALHDERNLTQNAIDEILAFYHIKSQELPDGIKDRNEQLEYLLRPHGIMRRTVTLSPGWHKDAVGAMLGVRKSNGSIAALIPAGLSGYTFLDAAAGKRIPVTGKNESDFETDAILFYKPFPLKKLNIWDLGKFMAQALTAADLTLLALASLAAALAGMLTPYIQRLLFSHVIPSGKPERLTGVFVFLLCAAVSSVFLTSLKALLSAGITTKLSVSVQAAAMMRVLSLPADFFKRYSAGELSSRVQYLHILCTMLATALLETGLTAIFSLIYLPQIFLYGPALIVPVLAMLLAVVLTALASVLAQTRVNEKQMALASQESGMSFALISGIQKIKLTGAEKRAFARWGHLYAQQAELTCRPPLFLRISSVIYMAIPLIGTVFLYYASVRAQMPQADYYAFSTAFGMLSGAFLELTDTVPILARIKPVLTLVEPILSTAPEISEDKQVLSRLSGGIELNNVSFRYSEDMPLVLDDLSLKIRSGQYVAIVGKSGCGKSTLLRLLLGFETPQKGAVYYDGKDLSKIDLKSLRRKTGVVMQNGRLFPGDIFSNITITDPSLTVERAWEAAETAGIAGDIRAMPMGMYTMISEGSGGISGGQRQRLLIARAIAPKPRILMFDEATSALDNLTQKKVSDALGRLKCTRIVIAHRLSTIQQCDRIIVLDKGKIVEDGKYGELLAKNGFFAELAARQRLDGTGNPGKEAVITE